MKLRDYISPSRTCFIERPASRDELLQCLAGKAAEAEPAINPQQLFDALLEREAKGATATPEGVALPHALLEGVERNFVVVARIQGGVNFETEAASPVDLVFMLIGPKDSPWEHIRILARVARICHTPGALDHLRAAGSAEMLHERLVAEDKKHV